MDPITSGTQWFALSENNWPILQDLVYLEPSRCDKSIWDSLQAICMRSVNSISLCCGPALRHNHYVNGFILSQPCPSSVLTTSLPLQPKGSWICPGNVPSCLYQVLPCFSCAVLQLTCTWLDDSSTITVSEFPFSHDTGELIKYVHPSCNKLHMIFQFELTDLGKYI